MKRMEPLIRDELLAMLDCAYQTSRQHHAMILLCYSHGLRAHEVAGLRVADVNVKDWRLHIRRGKRSKITDQAILSHKDYLLDERKTLQEWLAMRPASLYLFPSVYHPSYNGPLTRVHVYRIVRRYAELAGLPDSKRSPHALKHSLGQSLVDVGCDVALVQAALGHKDIGSTAHYFRISDTKADVARKAALCAE